MEIQITPHKTKSTITMTIEHPTSIDKITQEIIVAYLELTNHNISKVAKLLDISRQMIYNRLKK